MERYLKNQVAKAVVKEAVDQCNEIENSLEGCLMVLQKLRIPHLMSDNLETEFIESQRELCGKRSYTVCIGKRYPNLIDIDDDNELTEKSGFNNLIEYAGQKLESILRTQESILQRLENVNKMTWK